MAKQPVSGWVHEPLAAVLGTRAKVAVLRILWRSTAAMPYREVVRRSGMAYGSIALALGDLTASGIVEELEGGRERRVRLRSGHRLAAAIAGLLQVESDFFPAFRIELRSVAQACESRGLVSAAIVGATARREELLGREVEMMVIASDAAAVERCIAAFETARDPIAARFGVRLQVITYELGSARAMWRTRSAAVERGILEAELLMGAPLVELLSG